MKRISVYKAYLTIKEAEKKTITDPMDEKYKTLKNKIEDRMIEIKEKYKEEAEKYHLKKILKKSRRNIKHLKMILKSE